MLKTTALCVALAFGLVTTASADAVLFSDRDAFTADYGKAASDVEMSYTTTVPIDGIVYLAKKANTDADSSFGGGGAASFLNGADSGQDASEGTDGPIYGFGFEFAQGALECGAAVCGQSSYTVDVYSGDELVGSFTVTPGEEDSTFFGMTWNAPIDKFVVSEEIESEEGPIFALLAFEAEENVAVITPVPLPGSSMLLIVGLAGLGAMKMRRKRG